MRIKSKYIHEGQIQNAEKIIFLDIVMDTFCVDLVIYEHQRKGCIISNACI